MSALLRVMGNKKTPPMSERTQRTSLNPWYHLSLPLARPHRIQSYPQRDIGRTRRRLPLTRSFGARLRTVIGTPHLRSLAPPAALCGRSPRRLTECPSSLSNDVADTLLLCGAKVNSRFCQEVRQNKGFRLCKRPIPAKNKNKLCL